MIDMHSKYDNMHTNGMFNALICINNHVIACYHEPGGDMHAHVPHQLPRQHALKNIFLIMFLIKVNVK